MNISESKSRPPTTVWEGAKHEPQSHHVFMRSHTTIVWPAVLYCVLANAWAYRR